MRSSRALLASAARRILSPFVPSRDMLPFTFNLHRLGGSLEPELLHLDAFLTSRRTAIDVGANAGFYTYALSKRFQRVYAFEINDEVTNLIRLYHPRNVDLIHCGLSCDVRNARLYVPVADGLTQTGWGSLNRDNLPGAERVIEKDVSVKPLDDFKINTVDFIKIDVEGHEVEVLHGAAETIKNSRPTVLTELKSENVATVATWFLALNYKHCRLQDFIDVSGSRANHIFVPVERLGELKMARPGSE